MGSGADDERRLAGSRVWQSVAKIREQAPLVHNITNFVVMNTTANALLSLGASPVMAHALEEVEAMVGFANALVLNIGTLSTHWAEAMLLAGRAAKSRGIPVVLDPVGAGATPMRTDLCNRILREVTPTIVRGNASEILALGSQTLGTKGVDSTAPVGSALEAARRLADQYGCVVVITGKVDAIISKDAVMRVHNGHALMPRVTGMGCTASALMGAFAAVESDPLLAATHAMVVNGIAGELAGERAAGPGSFQMAFLDALHAIDRDVIEQRTRLRSE